MSSPPMSTPPLHEHKAPRINVKPPLLTIFWIRFGHRVTMETPNDCGVAEKSQLGHKYFLQYSTVYLLRKTLSSNIGAPNLLLALGAIEPRHAAA